MYVMLTRMKKMMCNDTNRICIHERSIFTDKNIFAKTLFDDGTMENIEYKVFTDWYENISTNIIRDIKGIIYLNVDPSLCYERIKKRNRTSENMISIDYLKKLHENHEQWLQKCNIPVLTINNNDEDDVVTITKFINSIEIS